MANTISISYNLFINREKKEYLMNKQVEKGKAMKLAAGVRSSLYSEKHNHITSFHVTKH